MSKKKIKFQDYWAELRPKNNFLIQSESFQFDLYTSSQVSNFLKKGSFDSKKLVLSKNYQ